MRQRISLHSSKIVNAVGIAVGLAIVVAFLGTIITVWYQSYASENLTSRKVAEASDVPKLQPDQNVTCIFSQPGKLECRVPGATEGGVDVHAKADLKAQQDAAQWSFLTMILTGVGAILNTVAVFFTAIAASSAAKASEAAVDSVRVARDAVALEHPPHLLATMFAVWDTADHQRKPPSLEEGTDITGSVWVVNAGRGRATIKPEDNLLMFYWGEKGNLPMLRPYDLPEREPRYRLNYRWPDDQNRELETGEVTGWENVSTVVPRRTLSNSALYIMGYIRYRSPQEKTRMLSFCRIYDPSKQNFVPVEGYPSYESEQ